MMGAPTEQVGSYGNTGEGHLILLRVGENSPGWSPEPRCHPPPKALALCWVPPTQAGARPHWLRALAAPGNGLTGRKALRILY